MTEPSPDAIIECARSWIGTRFSHQGRLKKTTEHKGGVDCLGLLIGIAAELNLHDKLGRRIAALDNRIYARIPDTSTLLTALNESLYSKKLEHIAAGDIALLNIQGSPQHLAIITRLESGDLGILHSYAQARRVVEHTLDDDWRGQLVAAFCLIEERKSPYENISE